MFKKGAHEDLIVKIGTFQLNPPGQFKKDTSFTFPLLFPINSQGQWNQDHAPKEVFQAHKLLCEAWVGFSKSKLKMNDDARSFKDIYTNVPITGISFILSRVVEKGGIKLTFNSDLYRAVLFAVKFGCDALEKHQYYTEEMTSNNSVDANDDFFQVRNNPAFLRGAGVEIHSGEEEEEDDGSCGGRAKSTVNQLLDE